MGIIDLITITLEKVPMSFLKVEKLNDEFGELQGSFDTSVIFNFFF